MDIEKECQRRGYLPNRAGLLACRIKMLQEENAHLKDYIRDINPVINSLLEEDFNWRDERKTLKRLGKLINVLEIHRKKYDL